MIAIIIAEDHNIVKDGLVSLIKGEKDMEVVAEANNGREVIDLLDNGQHADLILTDINMPSMGGIELAGVMQSRYPLIKVLMLSALDNEKYVIRSFKAGINGYILKSITSYELLFAIRHVFNGNQYICSELTTKFLNRMLTIPEPSEMATVNDISFTEKEVEVLSLLADGLTNQEIADKLFSSKRTIEGYRENMISKTGVRNTVALVRFAVLNGIIN